MSDHFSGPRAIAGPQCDICDFYAFVSPERAGRLVLVTNVVPNAAPGATFSDAIVYRFRLRTVSVPASGTRFAIGKDELAFDCTFATPCVVDGATVQDGVCTTPAGARVAFTVGDERGAEGGGVRVYAGRRADPFFLDFSGLAESMKSGRLAFRDPGTQTGPGANVLSVVVEIDTSAALAGLGPLVAAVGETVAAGPLGIRLERMGRPEVKNMLMNPRAHDTVNRTIELRDLYNLEDAFHVGPDYRDAYRARIDSNLAMFDRMDDTLEWPLDANGRHPLTDLVMDDWLVVDVTKPFAADGFIEIERAMLAGRPHTTSGGRSLNNDSMDELFTLYVNADRGPKIRDGVDRGTGTASDTFPYLAAPNAQREMALGGAANVIAGDAAASAAGATPRARTHEHTHPQGHTNSYTVPTADGGHQHRSFGRYGS